MTNMLATIAPKSDQLNADDLIGRNITINVTKVSLCAEPDQPIAIEFDGDNGKPYKPCKSMRRVLVNVWGPDGNAYIGRSMTLYRDDKVQFGGLAVGGIRISHMSDITKPVTMALTATRANRKPFTVNPLVIETKPDVDQLSQDATDAAAQGAEPYRAFWTKLTKVQRELLLPKHEALKAAAVEADAAKTATPAEPVTQGEDGWPGPDTASKEAA